MKNFHLEGPLLKVHDIDPTHTSKTVYEGSAYEGPVQLLVQSTNEK
jgi:hypothetical protein